MRTQHSSVIAKAKAENIATIIYFGLFLQHQHTKFLRHRRRRIARRAHCQYANHDAQSRAPLRLLVDWREFGEELKPLQIRFQPEKCENLIKSRQQETAATNLEFLKISAAKRKRNDEIMLIDGAVCRRRVVNRLVCTLAFEALPCGE